MGRALCLAALYPFRSVIGVELSPELCKIAQQNVDRIKAKLRCQDVQIVNGNAIKYKVPSDVSIIYFFNPFVGEVMRKVLDNIALSLRAAAGASPSCSMGRYPAKLLETRPSATIG